MFVGLRLVYTLLSVLAIFVVVVSNNGNSYRGRRKQAVFAFYSILAMVVTCGIVLSLWYPWFWLWIIAVIVVLLVLISVVDGIDRNNRR